jgi:hypothetical protein
MEGRHVRETPLQRKSGDAWILSSKFTPKFVLATWSLGFSIWIIWILWLLGEAFRVEHDALLNVEFVRSYKLAARVDLRGLRRISSDFHVFPGDFTRNRLPVVLSLLSQNWMLFRVGGWRPYCVLKQRWKAVSYCNSASHNTHWNFSCGIDITELA